VLEALEPLVLAVALEPCFLDQPAAQGCRGLLILAGEIVLADRPADVREGGERLTRGVQHLARLPGEALRPPYRHDLVDLVGFGDRPKGHDLPRLLPEHVADKVVLVQPLHDDDDGAAALVVKPAVEGVGVPIIGGISSRIGERLLRLQRVIDQDKVGAAPGQPPPVEVARR
jgi:hypothetical protein